MKQALLIYIIIALFAIGFVEGIPTASFNEPTDSGIITRNYILYNFTAFDENLKNASILLFDGESNFLQSVDKNAFAFDDLLPFSPQTGGGAYPSCQGVFIYSRADSILLNVTFYADIGATVYIKDASCNTIFATSSIDSNNNVQFNYNVSKDTTYCICADDIDPINFAWGANGLFPFNGSNFDFTMNTLGGTKWIGLNGINSITTKLNFDNNFSNLTYGDYIMIGQAYDSFGNINNTDNIYISIVCIPDWISSTTTCINDQQLITYTDNRTCGTEAPADNGTMIICGATKAVNVVNKSFISLLVILILLSVIMGILLYTQALSDEASKIIIPIFIFAIAAVCIIMMVIAFGALKTLS